jgi:lantibiotic modifying enzyme
MALALWELFAATDREDFRDAAGRAFAYEDRLFDAARGNWPDFRQRPAGMGDAERFSTAWCHGAPGIALARLRASQLDLQERESHRAVAAAGLATTARALAGALRSKGGDTSLCHGLTGLAEILWIGGRILGEPRHCELAESATRTMLAWYAHRDWPSGAPSHGPNPSLLLGTAGVGYWLLRLHSDGAVPSVLLPTLA